MRAGRDGAIFEIAQRQHGLVTRRQLATVGLSRRAIDWAVRSKRYEAVHRGVYRIGASSPRQREMAAALASPGSVVSHRSAAALWGMLPHGQDGVVEITVQAGNPTRSGIRAHRTPLPRDEVAVKDGVPVTTPSRTILDLAGTVSGRELEQALGVSEREGLGIGDLRALMARYPRRAGVGALRSLLARPERLPATRSEAEERLLALLRSGRLPSPEVNARVAGCEVDFLWRRERLIVEVDGFAYHSSRAQFEHDRRRDARLVAAGFTVMRITWRQLCQEREATLVQIALALTRAERTERAERD